jgi:hypothetical protein
MAALTLSANVLAINDIYSKLNPLTDINMANCSYLYLSNGESSRGENTDLSSMRHISTARHDIPFAYKLILSGDPKAIRTARGGPRKSFDVTGDRRYGMASLIAFLKRIDLPHAQPVIDHTLAYLGKPEHDAALFLLHPAEVFNLSGESHRQQVRAPIDEITAIDSCIESELARLHEPLAPVTIRTQVQPGFIARLFGAKAQPAVTLAFPDPLYRFGQIGLRNWHEAAN